MRDLTVIASSLGGKCGLQIHFHTGTGEVLLRRLSTRKLTIKEACA